MQQIRALLLYRTSRQDMRESQSMITAYTQQRNPSRVLMARQDNLTAPSAGEPRAVLPRSAAL